MNKEMENQQEYWLKVERSRKQQEPYKMKEVAGWMCWSSAIGFLYALISGAIIFFDGDRENWWIAGIGVIPVILWTFTSNIEEKWKLSWAAKEQVEAGKSYLNQFKSEGAASFFNSTDFIYLDGYIYTDSVLAYYGYQLSKFTLAFLTICLGLFAVIAAFVWLGSITIAPTTIIIILLVLILMKSEQ